jgi:beta-galactosidase
LKDYSAVNFNKNWKFLLGDPQNVRNENFFDYALKDVDLPHDWVISQPFNKGDTEGYGAQNMQGFFEWKGVGWYRKEFTLDCIGGNAFFVYFGGAYRNSTVFVNGKEAGGRAYGYSSFEIEITDFIKEGKNLIAVRLDNGKEAPDRWYSGSGLYRNVFLKTVPLLYIKTWGVHVKTKLSANKKKADISVTVTIISRNKSAKGAVNLSLIGPDGKEAAASSVPYEIGVNKEIESELKITLKNPALWSAEEPNLYRAVVVVDTNDDAIKPVEINIGIRSINIAYKKGMTVNGEKIKLKGVCLHHDAGITGAAYYDEVWRRRLLALKSIGCNAIRTSHNPPAEEFLDLCDELGFYVVDECFDKWKSGYYAAHFDADAKRDLTDFILRDRNHPCIFMWSVGNEVENQGTQGMLQTQEYLANIIRTLDDRPVTCALAPHANPRSLAWAPVKELVELTKKLAQDIDVLGLNYHEPLYDSYTKDIDKPILGTECYEYYSCSGTNFEDVTDKNPWWFVLENDNVIGQFIWAGIDYLGESSWPAKGWTGSIFDICGFMKPNAWFRKSIWSDEPFIYLALYDQNKKKDYARGRWSFPSMSSHLNFEYFKRRTVNAAIFTNCDEAELWINGKKMERRKRADYKNGIIEWTFEYTEGLIEVKGIKDGNDACSYTLKTAGKAEKIKLEPDKTELAPGEIAHIEVSVADANGLLCPNEEILIQFALEGDGKILGCCSPDLSQDIGFAGVKTVTSEGRALAIIKAGYNSGTIEVTASSEEMEKTTIKFEVGQKK